jgi:hypothetical protein
MKSTDMDVIGVSEELRLSEILLDWTKRSECCIHTSDEEIPLGGIGFIEIASMINS